MTGHGAQPLHTDGAHLEQPPDVVLLFANEPTLVPTLLWRMDWSRMDGPLIDALRHGLFTVDDGRTQFLSPAALGGRLRFDPGCMTPADTRATRAAEHFAAAQASATPFHWDETGKVLAIDNRRVLHARADATADPERVLERLAFRVDREGAT